MELKGFADKFKKMANRYRWALVVLLLGLVLMAIPTGGQKQTEAVQTPEPTARTDLAAELEAVLGKIQGVGRVEVLLSQASGEEVSYQSDVDLAVSGDSQTRRDKTVVISDSSRGQEALIRQVNPPEYLGAVVVCQGGDNAQVRYRVVEAVSSATGLAFDRISVQKMK